MGVEYALDNKKSKGLTRRVARSSARYEVTYKNSKGMCGYALQEGGTLLRSCNPRVAHTTRSDFSIGASIPPTASLNSPSPSWRSNLISSLPIDPFSLN